MNHESSGVQVTLLQINPLSRDKKKGIGRTLELVRKSAREQSGILILPEIWSGGFEYPGMQELADQTPAILRELSTISRENGSTIIGSLPEAHSGKLYNTAAVIDRGRIVGRYRKQRLFSPMQEDRHFATGRSKKTFSTSRGRIGVAICFDLRFPELFAGLRKSGAWLLVVPAQWPDPRCAHWETLLTARAIENQVYVAGCNRVGQTGGTRFCGASMIVDSWGKVLARAGRRPEVISSVVHPRRVGEVRKRIPMQGDS